VVLAETASSALVLTGMQLGLLLIGWLAFLADPADVPALGERSALLVIAALLLPVVNMLGMLIHNGAAILLPGWIHLGSGRPTGVEALGQNMLVLIGFAALLGLALVPPVAAAAGLYLWLEPGVGRWALLPAVAAAVAVAAGEGWLMVRRLGAAFERLDPAMTPAQG
jgi:hypothetical protein